MSNQINVDPNNVIATYQDKLAAVTHEAVVAQAAVNQLSSELSQVKDELRQRTEEVERLTRVPDNAEAIAPPYQADTEEQVPAQWGSMGSTPQ